MSIEFTLGVMTGTAICLIANKGANCGSQTTLLSLYLAACRPEDATCAAAAAVPCGMCEETVQQHQHAKTEHLAAVKCGGARHTVFSLCSPGSACCAAPVRAAQVRAALRACFDLPEIEVAQGSGLNGEILCPEELPELRPLLLLLPLMGLQAACQHVKRHVAYTLHICRMCG